MERLRIGLLYDQPQDLETIHGQLEGFEVVDLAHLVKEDVDETELVDTCRNVHALVTWLNTPVLPDSLESQRGKLQYICHTRGILKYFPRSYMEGGGRLSNWGEERGWIVADKVMALLLSLIIQLPALDHLSRCGDERRLWQDFPDRLEGFRLGLYGCGAIGRQVCQKALALGMQVSIFDPYCPELPQVVGRAKDLKELFASNYAVSIHAGLGPETENSVGEELLSVLPQGGILINSARGEIIDDAALLRALEAKRIVAGLDVLRDESDWTRSPYASQPNCILTQHGIRHPDYVEPLFVLPDYAEHNLHAFFRGDALRNEIVDLAHFDRTT